MALTKEQLLSELDKLLEAGDEQKLEEFIISNFADLPEDTQREMLMSYLKDAMRMRDADAFLTDMHEKALDALKQLSEEK